MTRIEKVVIIYGDGKQKVLSKDSAIVKQLRGEYSKTISISLPRK